MDGTGYTASANGMTQILGQADGAPEVKQLAAFNDDSILSVSFGGQMRNEASRDASQRTRRRGAVGGNLAQVRDPPRFPSELRVRARPGRRVSESGDLVERPMHLDQASQRIPVVADLTRP